MNLRRIGSTHDTGRRWLAPMMLSVLLLSVALPIPASARGTLMRGHAVATPGAWIPTGSMLNGRQLFTATALWNGKVLVTGGCGCTSAELYDPRTGTWTATGSLHAAQGGATATLLHNGTVLVAGGCTIADADGCEMGALASAEVYNPRSGTWSLTGPMTTARLQHTATLLPNGKVLLAGGLNNQSCQLFGCTALASAELYNPATHTFRATGSMETNRYGQTATLLPTGKVLVTGGNYGCGFGIGPTSCDIQSSAELYDPRTGTFSPTGTMSAPRQSQTATLLFNGDVLVAGGLSGTLTNCCTPLSSAELYDPRTGVFTPTGSMSTARFEQTATPLFNGQVLIAGGLNCYVCALSIAELYNPRTGAFTDTASLPTPLYQDTATLLYTGGVLVAGGNSGNGPALASADVFSTAVRT